LGEGTGAGSGEPLATSGDGTGAGSGEPLSVLGEGTGAGSGEPLANSGEGTGAGSGDPLTVLGLGTGAGNGDPLRSAAIDVEVWLANTCLLELLPGSTIKTANDRTARRSEEAVVMVGPSWRNHEQRQDKLNGIAKNVPSAEQTVDEDHH